MILISSKNIFKLLATKDTKCNLILRFKKIIEVDCICIHLGLLLIAFKVKFNLISSACKITYHAIKYNLNNLSYNKI